jgi:hypothetical protein
MKQDLENMVAGRVVGIWFFTKTAELQEAFDMAKSIVTVQHPIVSPLF